jgi:small subunit ribosomal protein S19e
LPTPFDVPADIFIERLAKYIKEEVSEVSPPPWALTAKTGAHAEHPPKDPDWWYVRCASLLRKLYIKGPIGVSRLRSEYGGRKRSGRRAERVLKGGGSAIREPLQQLEAAGLVEKVGKRGRGLTSEGRSLLDRIATQILKELKRGGDGG